MSDFEKQLDDSLQRLSDLIEKLAQSQDADDVKSALVAASQLARIQARVAESRRGQEPEQKEDREPVSKDRFLEAIRVLVEQHAERMGYVRVTDGV